MSVPARQTKNVDLIRDDPERLLDVSEAAEGRLDRGALTGRLGADLRLAAGNAQVLAIRAVAARLARIFGALGAAIDAAQVVVHAEARPLAARRAAFLLFRFLPLGIQRRAVLSMRRAGQQRQKNRFSSAAPPHGRSSR